MKIAFCIRSDYLNARGGDTFQLLHTKEALERTCDISISVLHSPDEIVPGAFDLCHLFNIQKIADTKAYLARCRDAGVKVAFSTIMWDFSAVVSYNFMVQHLSMYQLSERRIGIMTRLLRLLSGVVGMPTIYTGRFREYLRQVLSAADLLLPNSVEEAGQLARLSGLDMELLRRKTLPVTNAVSVPGPEATVDDTEGDKYDLPPGYVLQVGRIEPGKNQYGTILSLMGEPQIPLVFVGSQRVNVPYFRETEALARRRGNVRFIDESEHGDLPPLYRRAALHVLPSLGETTGLVSLEALASGCRVVVSDSRYCPFDSYFSGIATPVDPLDVRSIRDGIFAELGRKRDMVAISRDVRRSFSWEVAARQTYEGYRRILDGCTVSGIRDDAKAKDACRDG